jgi:hypothetical protein
MKSMAITDRCFLRAVAGLVRWETLSQNKRNSAFTLVTAMRRGQRGDLKARVCHVLGLNPNDPLPTLAELRGACGRQQWGGWGGLEMT